MISLAALFANKFLRSTLKVVGIGALLLLVIWGAIRGINYIRLHPEQWNATADGYLLHTKRLAVDSAYWHNESLHKDQVIVGKDSIIARKDSVIAKRDSTIAYQQGEWQKAINYGNEWKRGYDQQVMASDATNSQLTDRERELALYDGMIKNGTLKRASIDINKLQPKDPMVIAAALNTTGREAIAKRKADSLGIVTGLLRTATERMGPGLSSASNGLSVVIGKATEAMKGGIPVLRRKKRRQLKGIIVSADSTKRIVDKAIQHATELEGELNKPHD